MDEFGTNVPRDDIYSKAVRAGKRTYFFDVKSTRSNELYLTITESKRRFNQQTGKFFYEKHKLFLYQEDFDKFREALGESFKAIDELQGEIIKPDQQEDSTAGAGNGDSPETPAGETKPADDISFEDLDDQDNESGEEGEEGDKDKH
ncbi:MAG: DUF3276 family protein [Bacteroidales bacterium]